MLVGSILFDPENCSLILFVRVMSGTNYEEFQLS